MPAALNPQLEMVALEAFALREPVSKRAYTCLRLRTRSGTTGYGECSRISPADLALLRSAIQGRAASSYESIRRGLATTPAALAGLDMAMLDVFGKFTKAPVYHVLGGPTRNQVRALARVEGDTDNALVAAVTQARSAGHRAFLIPLPRTNA